MRRIWANYKLRVNVLVEPSSAPYDNFTIADNDFAEGETRQRPYDFDLHLGIYLLEKENAPTELLEPLKLWAKEHPMVVICQE